MSVERVFTFIALTAAMIPIPLARGSDAVVVVCPAQFREAIQPWLGHRNEEGLECRVIDSQSDATALQNSIREASDGNTRYVLLVGDAPVFGTPCNPLRQTPMLYSPTKVTAAWGSTPTLSSDMLYGDFDQDQIPDASVGRLPVDHPQQLVQLIERIKAHERSRDFGAWRGNVQLVGGVGGFGALADNAIESVTRTIVTGVLPAETRTTVCYASPGHVFFPTEQSFTDAVVNRYQQGARFWVYAGHGQVTALDRVPRTAQGTPVLDQQSVKRLIRPGAESSIAVMLACYTGALDAAEDSIAEEMVMCQGGPIAVFAGSRVTMPYGNTTAAVGLIDGVFKQKLPRLGDAWRGALVQMHRESPEDTSSTRMMIDALATMVSPAGTNLVDERREHMLLYNLIGDPTLRLHHPQSLAMELPAGHESGEPIQLQINSPISGQLKLSCDRPLGAVTQGDPNETTVASLTSHIDAGQTVSQEITIPGDVKGPIIVRALVSGEATWATAAVRTIVR